MDAIIFVILGLVVGVWGSVIGGSLFFGIPALQWLRPELSFTQAIGNLKVGSVTRSVGTILATLKEIQWKIVFTLGIPMALGSVVGVFFINQAKDLALGFILLGILLTEGGKWITKKEFKPSPATFYVGAFLLGIYAGIIGAGIGIITVMVLRLKYTDDSQIGELKVQARASELLAAIVTVTTHYLHGNIFFYIAVPYAIGAFIGGYIGGNFLKEMMNLSKTTQKRILYASYIFAIVVQVVALI